MNTKIIYAIISLALGIGIGLKISDMHSVSPSPHSTHAVMDMTEHSHASIEVDSSLPIPTVDILTTKDAKDGYNLQIVTKDFTFTPETVNEANVPNTGHAHLYINGVKIGRLYGYWYHIPSTMLQNGDNLVEITLNNNDHSDLTLNNEHIGKVVTLTK